MMMMMGRGTGVMMGKEHDEDEDVGEDDDDGEKRNDEDDDWELWGDEDDNDGMMGYLCCGMMGTMGGGVDMGGDDDDGMYGIMMG